MYMPSQSPPPLLLPEDCAEDILTVTEPREEEAAAELEDPPLGWNEKLEDDVESCFAESKLGARKVMSP